MKILLFLFFAIACLLICPLSYSAEYGDTKAAVVAEHGEPLSRRFMAEGRELWQYPRGQITLMNDHVIKIVMPGSKAAVQRIPSGLVSDDGPEVHAHAAEALLAPTVAPEGVKLAKDLRSSVDFLVSPPERQMEILRSFQTRYPAVDVGDLVRSVERVKGVREKRATPWVPVQSNREVARLRERTEAAEREAAAAQARVQTERQRLESEIQRRREAEREADRQAQARRTVLSPYAYGYSPHTYHHRSGYGYHTVAPSVTYTPRIYTPSYTFQNTPDCQAYGFIPYRTIKTRPLTRHSGLGSLAFGGGTR